MILNRIEVLRKATRQESRAMVRGVSSSGLGIVSRGTSVTPSLCKCVRFRKSDCRMCAEVCPESAIELQPGPTISDSCTDCGLCQVACPTEAFATELSSERLLLYQVESLRDRHEGDDARLTLGFRCRRARRRHTRDISVRCLGSITENVLIGAAVAGFSEVVLARGACERCRWKSAETLFNRSVRNAVSFLRCMGLTEFCVQLEDRENNGRAAIGRRDMLSDVARKLASRIRAATDEERRATVPQALVGTKPRYGYPVMGSRRRRLLKTIVGDLRREDRGRLSHDPELPWGLVRVEADLCVACGICVEVCPTGAIDRSRKGDHHVLTFSTAECTNCSLCQEACPQSAIDFEDSFAVADVWKGETAVVADVRLTSCTMCGGVTPAGQGATCPTCARRQISTQGAVRWDGQEAGSPARDPRREPGPVSGPTSRIVETR